MDLRDEQPFVCHLKGSCDSFNNKMKDLNMWCALKNLMICKVYLSVTCTCKGLEHHKERTFKGAFAGYYCFLCGS